MWGVVVTEDGEVAESVVATDEEDCLDGGRSRPALAKPARMRSLGKMREFRRLLHDGCVVKPPYG